jgi:hypothetical protein
MNVGNKPKINLEAFPAIREVERNLFPVGGLVEAEVELLNQFESGPGKMIIPHHNPAAAYAPVPADSVSVTSLMLDRDIPVGTHPDHHPAAGYRLPDQTDASTSQAAGQDIPPGTHPDHHPAAGYRLPDQTDASTNQEVPVGTHPDHHPAAGYRLPDAD